MLILLTNDDGIHSPGLSCLEKALSPLGDIAVVAPDRERSAVAHALTLHHPLRAELLGDRRFAVDGTPTDCINLGIHGLLNQTPDLIVSGVNRGANLGDDITYSGTVAAAMEGALMGVPSIAVSLEAQTFDATALIQAGDVAMTVARHVLDEGLPADTFLNVNLPSQPHQGYAMTRQGRRRYADAIVRKQDPRGRDYYWIGNDGVEFELAVGTDAWALHHRYVSVTPLHLDLTNHRAFAEMSGWSDGQFFTERG